MSSPTPITPETPIPQGGFIASFNARSWYWTVGNHPDVVYSAGQAAYVPADDATYTAWLEQGHVPTAIISDGELADALTTWSVDGPAVLNTAPTDWGACNPSSIYAAVRAAGVHLTNSKSPELSAHYPLGAALDSMANVQSYINSFNALPNGQPVTIPCYDKTVTITSTGDFSKVYQGLLNYAAGWQSWAQHRVPPMPAWGATTIQG